VLSPTSTAHVLLALELPRAIHIGADGVTDKEEVVDRKRKFLVAKRVLGEGQASKELRCEGRSVQVKETDGAVPGAHRRQVWLMGRKKGLVYECVVYSQGWSKRGCSGVHFGNTPMSRTRG
jgi:hypothetical protein